MDKTPIPQLDELAQAQPGALEAALEEMINSGFGDLEANLPQQQFPMPTPGPKAQSFLGWW
jgi:hypothetical protein